MSDSATPAKASAASSGTAGSPEKPTLSATEANFFVNIVVNMMNQPNKPDVDWEKVAEQSGFKNAGVAKTRFGQIKKKLGITANGTVVPPAPKPARAAKEPKTPKKASASKSGVEKGASTSGKKHKGSVTVKKEEEEGYTAAIKDEELDDQAMEDAIAGQIKTDSAAIYGGEAGDEERDAAHQVPGHQHHLQGFDQTPNHQGPVDHALFAQYHQHQYGGDQGNASYFSDYMNQF